MRIGLIDVDSHNFPNIALMKWSSYHKAKGDTVEWHIALGGHYDIVYVSKIFSFSPDYQYPIDADQVVYGGSGYCIGLKDGHEFYDKSKDTPLPYEVEHSFPDYSIYPQYEGKAYGMLTRGCPRGCSFCHTGVKDGLKSHKVADLKEFWNGQKEIVLLDQNLLACKDWRELVQQLKDSKSYIDFNGGTDIRLMTDEKAKALCELKVKEWHFAWDRYQDKEIIIPKFELFNKYCKKSLKQKIVYTLVNYDTTLEQDLDRIYTLRDLGYSAYVMVYDKEHLPRGHIYKKLQRWVNNRFVFNTCKTFDEYLEVMQR